MTHDPSVEFFDRQFERQVRAGEFALNPFERAALPYMAGEVLDFGCGLGNLACEAARQGHRVLALDASPVAIAHLHEAAQRERLPLEARRADLRNAPIERDFDTVVSIGLLMFFDCPTAERRLRDLQAHVRPAGVAVVNLLVQGTTYLEMFDPASHCLLPRDALLERFAGWELLHHDISEFAAPSGRLKVFATLIARRPQAD